ncbi:FRG domain-containing protein [Metabacillus sediminilitoris]|uniref:FRG domain-containing protein n=1 Tax=Metabacillus sediminilitoris TaxID=2567941 RepID=A0A4S4BWR4_9BACI|nr:FRG domain-containing protein [Metabacillus sediminilitoris]QGQ44757.1 FRG domain-containing protein [Metabacillus sediminilitoris]THF78895.1 FRG domain-containing protein [Metabacillus sediminilitoris]
MEQANSISIFNKVIEHYSNEKDVWFRGQGAKYEEITSSIARDKGYLNYEFALYAESIEMKQNEFEPLSKPIQRLAKLQHYGIPTRLIDVTTEPLIALFFAVQDTKKDDGYVYLYSQKSHEMNSKQINLLSLLATLKDYDIGNIQQQYKCYFYESISKEEILNLAEETIFVKPLDELKELNPRLYNQKGTFAICGNIVEGEKILRQLKTLDTIEPIAIVKIPYEYKASVKRELDEKYGINETFIYPELPSVAEYIKEKYKYINFSSEGMYSVIEESDIPHPNASRVSLVIVLNEPLNIDEIKKIVVGILEEKSDNDVVWIYVAKNGSDYIMRNWILTGQWINNSLDDKYKPIAIGEMDEKGFYWNVANDYSVLSDYYEENVFIDDKILFIKNHGLYEAIFPLYNLLRSLFISQKIDLFDKEVSNNAELINECFMNFGDFGHSKDKYLDDFLHKYQEFIAIFDNIPLWVKREDLSSEALNYQISRCFQEADEIVKTIQSEGEIWREKLNIKQRDIENAKKYSHNSPF